MVFSLRPDENGRSRIHLTDEPEYIVPLRIAPPFLEHFVQKGVWLVVSMSVWSVHDIRAGHQAIEVVKRHGGRIKLGLRPFDYPKEHGTWIAALRADSIGDDVEILVNDNSQLHEAIIQGLPTSTPVWAGFIDGQVVSVHYGQLTNEAIEGIIDRLISKGNW